MISVLILTSYIVSQISIIILHNSRLSFFLIFRISYRKNPKISDTPNICCNHPKSLIRWLFFRVMHPNEEGIANSVDPAQSILSLHCLPRPVCPKTSEHYGVIYCQLEVLEQLGGGTPAF